MSAASPHAVMRPLSLLLLLLGSHHAPSPAVLVFVPHSFRSLFISPRHPLAPCLYACCVCVLQVSPWVTVSAATSIVHSS